MVIGEEIAGLVSSAVGPHAALFVISLVPVIEPRYALVIGVTLLGVPFPEALAVSLASSVILATLLSYIIERILASLRSGVLSKVPGAKRFVRWLEERSLSRVSPSYEKYGLLGLVLFVAVPLPMTGIYTGAVASILLGVESKKRLAALAVGGAASVVLTGAATGLLAP